MSAAPDIRFYHLTTRSLESALPEILAKALAGGRRVVVRVAHDGTIAALSEALWTAQPDSFLPHGSAADGHAADQPIWLTTGTDNPNNADVLVLAGGGAEEITNYALCCAMLDGRDEAAVDAARAQWKTWRAEGMTVTYWKQTETGGWEKKA